MTAKVGRWSGALGAALLLVGAGASLAQGPPRSFNSRPAAGPPTPAPRSFSGDTIVLPRVPYDNRLDSQRRVYRDDYPNTRPRRRPESQRVVPAAPGAGGDPARFFDQPAGQPLTCESLRRLAVETNRQLWIRRYQRCLGGR